jgi:hypothetical protein
METTESSNTLVTPSLRSLLSDVLDYAGLFPPAELPLREALRNYEQYRHDPEAWMLARFVIPVGQLADLTAFSKLFREPEPYSFSVLGTGGASPEAFVEAFARDLDTLRRFHTDHRDRVLADVMEVRLPPSLLDAPAPAVRSFFERVHRELVASGMAQLDLFYEISHPITRDRLQSVLAIMADHNSTQAVPARSTVGLKIRCGGTSPDAFPPVEHLARIIVGCRNAGVRFKATAGLHHPVRHYSETYETPMHGFLNVFGAAALAIEHELSEEGVRAVLLEDDPDAFQFTKEAFIWRDREVPVDTILYAREHLATSFGSCSFDEPRDDLKELELIR